jgi:hypothetical protein
MNTPELRHLILRQCRERADAFGLDRNSLDAKYVLNWGGFVAASYTLSDGVKTLHLKLVRTDEERATLRRWEAVKVRLEGDYHAPRMIGWLDVDGSDYSGPIFEHICGETLDLNRYSSLFEPIAGVLERLHSDEELAKELQGDWAGRTHLDAFRSRFVEMFREDLSIIKRSLPPFVSRETYEWMASETGKLDRIARESRAFGGRAVTPTHGDVWENNILVTTNRDWFLLDWDDLSLGDPAMDYATLAWPLAHGRIAVDWMTLPIPKTDERFAERMAIYQRAIMLDWVVDVLADWIEAEQVPSHCEIVRAQKHKDYLTYLAMYREKYE